MSASRLWICSLLCLAFGVPVQAEDDPQAALKARLARVQALRAERPGDGLLAYYQAMTHASLGDKAAALAELRALKGRKLGLVPSPGLGFDALWADADFQAVRQELAADEPRTPDAPVGLRLPDPKLIPEGIAHDARGKRFFLSSVALHKIVVVDAKGRTKDFSRKTDKLDAVLGLAVDAPRGVLYAVSTNGFEDSNKLARRNAVLRYDLRTGKLLGRLEGADALQFNDVAVADDGSVYVSDSAEGSLWRLKPGEAALARFGEKGSLRGANGLAVGQGNALYVTLSTGIARVDATTGEAMRMPQPDTVMTGGIDGLYWRDQALFGVQNSTNPGRVIRVALAADGRSISGMTVLQSHHHPALDEPTTGTLVGDKLYVIANSFVGRYQADGSLKDAASLKPTLVLAVPLQR
ncbi:hypothetical protein [Chitinimonas sp. JJ19]|uniref:hypothetical protein n=1 Tax=Chitinimonas sp. JJ19 TaxID=3109352 RepID=UPI00300251CF